MIVGSCRQGVTAAAAAGACWSLVANGGRGLIGLVQVVEHPSGNRCGE